MEGENFFAYFIIGLGGLAIIILLVNFAAIPFWLYYSNFISLDILLFIITVCAVVGALK